LQRFAANLSMMFDEMGFLDRFHAAARAGFDAVEFLFPYDFSPADIQARLDAAALDIVLFNMPPGDFAGGERGIACLAGRESEFATGIETAIAYARALGVPRLHAMAGLRPEGADTAALDRTYIANIASAASACAAIGIDLLIEPINTHDIPRYHLDDFGMAIEMIAAVAATGAPAPRLQFDIYHCQRIHGDVPGWIARAAPHIAHYQIAGVPGRHEPDNGDLPFAAILEAVEHFTPGLTIGCEYKPTADTLSGLGWFAPYRRR